MARGLVAAGIVGVVTAQGPAGAMAHDDDPRIEADVELAAPGAPLTVRGYEFPYEDVVEVALQGADGSNRILGSASADVEGSFTYAVVLPIDLAEGSYGVIASDGHHTVDGPVLRVVGQPLVDGDGDQRQEDDGLLAPMPTFAPALAPAAAVAGPEIASPPVVASVGEVDPPGVIRWVVTAALITAVLVAGGAISRRIWRSGSDVTSP